MFCLFFLMMEVLYKLRIKLTSKVGGLDFRVFIFDEALKVQNWVCFYHKLMKKLVRRRADWDFILLHDTVGGYLIYPFCFLCLLPFS